MKRDGESNISIGSSFLRQTFFSLLIFAWNLMITTSQIDLSKEAPENVTMINSEVGPKNGSFHTLGFPGYPNNFHQRFQFRAKVDEVVWITWLEFDLEQPDTSTSLTWNNQRQCRDDYVEVIVIDFYNVQHVHGRYCGNVMPPNFTTMQYSVDIIFKSSITKNHRGFRGEYRFIEEKSVPPPNSAFPGKTDPHAAGCGGVIQGQYGGVIVSPGYPEDYPAHVDCNWVIRVRSGHQVFIKVVELELTPTLFTQCDEAQLMVLDGYALILNDSQTLPLQLEHAFQRIQLCGNPKYHKDEGSKSIMSDRNRMVIRFKTTKPPADQVRERRKEVGSPIGFRLVWTEVSLEKTCSQFLCRGGEYCIDEGKRVCAERKRYCIDSSLVCDGVPNCAESDDSDEENCYSKEIITAAVALFSLLLLIIIVVVCCQRHRGRKLMQWALDERVTQETITPNDVNFVSSQNQLDSSDFSKAPLRVALMNKMDKSPLPRNRGGEIAALPQNCYPARSVSVADDREDVAVRQPFLAVPNHAPTPTSATYKTPTSPHFKFSETDIKLSRGRDSLRKISRDAKKPSITLTTAPSRVPEINVVRAPNNHSQIWEHRGSDSSARALSPRELTPESLSDNESPLWKEFEPAESKGTAEVNVIRRRRSSASVDYANEMEPPPPPVFPPVLHEEDEQDAESVEMVTFSPRPPPPPLLISAPASNSSAQSSARLQGILKSSASLPPSYQPPVQKLPPSYRAVVSVEISSPDLAAPRRTGNTTTVAVHRVPAVPVRTAVTPSTASLTPEHPRMVRQKAVEINEQPYIARRSNAPPPLNLPRTDVSSTSTFVEPKRNNDRSPSPWHQRIKPTAV